LPIGSTSASRPAEQSVNDSRALVDGTPPALLAAGVLWGGFLAAAFLGHRTPGASFGAAAVSRSLLALLVGLAHGSALGLVAGAISHGAGLGRRPRRGAALLLLALVAGTYSFLGLSVAKLLASGSPLRFDDLWFLGRGFFQLVSEGTARERGQLLGALSLPLALFALLAVAARSRVARATRLPPQRMALLLGASLAGVVAVGNGHVGSREAARQLFPDLRWAWSAAVAESPPSRPAAAAEGSRIEPYPARLGDARANVLVLMLESIPWKRLFGPQARPESTPRLLALAEESIVFDRAYATSTHSDYAQTSILASLHPRHGPGHDYFTRLDYPRTLFWDPLRPLGYRTAVFSCQNEGWGNMIAFLRTPGLELLRHSPDWPEAPHRGDGPESKVFEATVVEAFLEWVDREPDRPFAAYLNFQATHYPYVAPPDRPSVYSPAALDFETTFLSYPIDKIPVMENRFHNALAYVDEQVGALLDALGARGRLESTALLVVSDHGEAFYEHGLPTHGTTLLEEQVRTAMLLRLPGEAPRRIAEPVSVLDAVPLVYRALGLPRHGNFQGRDDVLEPGYSGAARPLLFTIQGMTREEAVLAEDWKYLVNWDQRSRALFDLGRDPDERWNLAAERPEETSRLDGELRRLLALQLGYYQSRGWERGRYPPPLP
jgi:arylsulfatase A-like enzyme